jgi:hypothetical protein
MEKELIIRNGEGKSCRGRIVLEEWRKESRRRIYEKIEVY